MDSRSALLRGLVAHRLDHERLVVAEIALCERLQLGRRRRLDLADALAASIEPVGLARRLGDLLNWDETERASQIEAYRREVEPMRRFSTVPGSEFLVPGS